MVAKLNASTVEDYLKNALEEENTDTAKQKLPYGEKLSRRNRGSRMRYLRQTIQR